MKDISLYEKIPLLKNNFTIKVMKCTEHILFPHWHEHIELLYFLSGSCRVTCDGNTFCAKGGDLVIVNGTEVHSFNSDKDVTYYCLLIYPEFFSDINFGNVMLENLICNDAYINEILEKIYAEHLENSEGSDMIIKGLAYSLMAHLIRGYTAARVPMKAPDFRTAALNRLDTVLEYISCNYSDRITTAALAEMCYLNESYFCRFFKATTGKSVISYINEYRVEKAALLLKNTNDKISKIATDTGFDDVNYFSRVFKKFKKQTPKEYRKK